MVVDLSGIHKEAESLLTMAMLTKVIKRDIPASKIIVVTDRKDLDRQIHMTFANSEIQAGRASSGHDLIEKLQSGDECHYNPYSQI